MCDCFFKTCAVIAILISSVLCMNMYLFCVLIYWYTIDKIVTCGLVLLAMFPIEAIYGVFKKKPAQMIPYLFAQVICLAVFVFIVADGYDEGRMKSTKNLHFFGIITGLSLLLFVITFMYYRKIKRENVKSVSDEPLTVDHNSCTVIPLHTPTHSCIDSAMHAISLLADLEFLDV
ncbi:uncharacterized protein LOC135847876 [Planococcus citri]|uniref:uncharacterized protein LOC135847876 n=1 Tax=Planococcus citri TaxID=170843 RepID=UPI0031F99BF0